MQKGQRTLAPGMSSKGGGGYHPRSSAPSLRPATALAFGADCNRPKSIGQPRPTACPTASGAASGVPSLQMHPWPAPMAEQAAQAVLWGGETG